MTTGVVDRVGRFLASTLRKGQSRLRIVVLLHTNIRSGANLAMLINASLLADFGHQVHVVFEHDWEGQSIDFVAGHDNLDVSLMKDYIRGSHPMMDWCIVNWWNTAYECESIPALRYAYFRHGDEKLLYDTTELAPFIDKLFEENFHWYAVSTALASQLKIFGHSPVVIPNGVHFKSFQQARPSLPPKQRNLRILVEGSPGTPFKQVEPAISLLNEFPEVEIVHMSADNVSPVGHVQYPLGAVPATDVAGVYASCDLIVRIPTIESFGMPILEQFAAGGTAIVADFPASSDYIHNGVNAIVVDQKNAIPSARTALRELIDHPSSLARLRRNAVRTAKAFDWRTIARRLENDLLKKLATPSPRQRLLVVRESHAAYLTGMNRWLVRKT